MKKIIGQHQPNPHSVVGAMCVTNTNQDSITHHTFEIMYTSICLVMEIHRVDTFATERRFEE